MSRDDNSQKPRAPPTPTEQNQGQPPQRRVSVQSLITREDDSPLPSATRAAPDPSSSGVHPTTPSATTEQDDGTSGTARQPQARAATRPVHGSTALRGGRFMSRPRRGRRGVRRALAVRGSRSVEELPRVDEEEEEEEEDEEEGDGDENNDEDGEGEREVEENEPILPDTPNTPGPSVHGSAASRGGRAANQPRRGRRGVRCSFVVRGSRSVEELPRVEEEEEVEVEKDVDGDENEKNDEEEEGEGEAEENEPILSNTPSGTVDVPYNEIPESSQTPGPSQPTDKDTTKREERR